VENDTLQSVHLVLASVHGTVHGAVSPLANAVQSAEASNGGTPSKDATWSGGEGGGGGLKYLPEKRRY
jgi:hypothetical protein